MLREFRADDAQGLFQSRTHESLLHEFPEEEAILGIRPEGFERIVRRIYRWDVRFLLGALRLFGRSPFRFFVVVDGGRIVGTTLLTFPPAAGYVSMVVVDAAFRGRGHARRLIEAARAATARRRRPYVVLDVLESNGPARRLYEGSGYRTLRSNEYLVHDTPATFRDAGPEPAGIRRFQRSDIAPLVAIGQRSRPPEVARVLPITAGTLVGSGWVEELLASESSSWVVDRGRGPEAFLIATLSPATSAAMMSAPVAAPSTDPATLTALVRAGAHWLAERSPPRIVIMVPEEARGVRAALEGVGFRPALSILTLYRPSE